MGRPRASSVHPPHIRENIAKHHISICGGMCQGPMMMLGPEHAAGHVVFRYVLPKLLGHVLRNDMLSMDLSPQSTRLCDGKVNMYTATVS